MVLLFLEIGSQRDGVGLVGMGGVREEDKFSFDVLSLYRTFK